MRIVALLVVAAAAVSCSNNTPMATSVSKYCVLTTMPRSTAGQLMAIHDRAVQLFAQRTPYLTTDANRRVIADATTLTTVSALAARQLQQPDLFRGQPKGLGLGAAVTELAAACTALHAGKKGHP